VKKILDIKTDYIHGKAWQTGIMCKVCEIKAMPKRTIFNISPHNSIKCAYVQALIPLVRAALPHVAKGTLELGTMYATEKAVGFITNQVAKHGVNSFISSLTSGGGKDAGDVKKMLSGILSANPNSPGIKKLLPDGKTRGLLEGVLNGLESGSSTDRNRRGGLGGVVDRLTGRDHKSPEWKTESRPFRAPSDVRVARRTQQ
jgi:hypothetical protein